VNEFFSDTLSPYPQLFIAVLGLIWGSFFNVVIHRLPLDEPLAMARSKCPNCQAPIPWYLNVPILSYLLLRGKCRACKTPISIEYPVVEFSSAILFLLVFRKFGWSFDFFAYTLFSSSLLVVTVIDLHHQIIPDEISLPGIVLGFGASFFLHEVGWMESLLGIVAGGGTFWAVAFLYEKITKREGLGGGDIKLLAMIGAWLGIKCVFPVIMLSSALGSVVGLTLMAVQRKNFKAAIPFGPFLAASAALCLFFRVSIQNILFP
jgi:leader peptidase (prepilin peptidase)/N-methyltransferase